MKRIVHLSGILAGILLLTAPAEAAIDNFYLGTGKDGALTAFSSNTLINDYAPVTAPLSAGDLTLTIGACSSSCPAAGDLIMIWQATGITPEPASGNTSPVNITGDPVGRWELARVSSVSGSTVTMTGPLVYSYAANVTQIIKVREYTNVTINSGGSISCPAWNGQTGGIVAFLCTGTLSINGAPSVVVTGKGFRGGAATNDLSGSTGSSGLDEPAPTGARKGEGIAYTRFAASATGRGCIANGGGGGVAWASGGGGGGNSGTGGQGGNSELNVDGNRSVGGQGGTGLLYSVVDHLVMGGGGGCGHGTNGTTLAGGAGGGVIFVRANALAGAGTMIANGALGGSADQDAGSGGGAGGTIHVRIAGAAACGNLQAMGGGGGSASADMGPGGGGGGGRILLQRGSGTCSPSATAINGGNPGVQPDAGAPGGNNYGAQPGSAGVRTIMTTGFAPVTSPVVTTPANNSTTVYRPNITGTAPANAQVTIRIDNATFTTTAGAGGSFSYQLTAAQGLGNGAHTLQVYAYDAAQGTYSSITQRSFTVSTALPVELVSFRAAAQQDRVLLTWETASERNSERYIVERSADGIRFEPVASVPAAGSSDVSRAYTAADKAPLSGMNFYRLKMLEQDGTASYSAIASVNMGREAAVAIAPNPVHERTTITITAAAREAAIFTLTATDGRTVRTYPLTLQPGANMLELERGSLPQGLYIYHLRTANGRGLATGKLAAE